MAYESKLRYQAKYKKANIKKVSIEFNINNQNDVDLINWLKEQHNKTELIKSLLYLKMSENKK